MLVATSRLLIQKSLFIIHFSFFILKVRFDSMLEAAEYLFAQGETSSVVAAQLIISQVCNGRRRSGFGYYWEFPHRGRPMTLETRKKRR